VFWLAAVLHHGLSSDSRHLARTLLDKRAGLALIAALLLAQLRRRVMSQPAHQAAKAGTIAEHSSEMIPP
jgi:hypothetical protein